MGHIGSYLIDNPKNFNNFKKVVLIDNFLNNKHNYLFNLKFDKKFDFYYRDLTKSSSLNKLPKIDYCLHLASITNAQESFNNQDQLFDNNLGCFKNVLNFCIKKKIKLLHISTTSLYGISGNLINEKSKVDPQSPYAQVKLKEEKILRKNSKKIKYVTLRFGTISGVSKNMRFHTAVNKFCFNAAMKTEIPVWATAYKQYRPYLTLKDALKSIKFIFLNDIFNGETYNILSGNLRVKDFILKIKKYKKIKIKYTKTKIMNHLSYKVSKLKIEKLGLKINSNFNKEIKDTIKLFK